MFCKSLICKRDHTAVQSGKYKWDGDELNGWLHHEGVSKSEHRASTFTLPPDIHSATTKNFHIASQLTALGLVQKDRWDVDVVRLICIGKISKV